MASTDHAHLFWDLYYHMPIRPMTSLIFVISIRNVKIFCYIMPKCVISCALTLLFLFHVQHSNFLRCLCWNIIGITRRTTFRCGEIHTCAISSSNTDRARLIAPRSSWLVKIGVWVNASRLTILLCFVRHLCHPCAEYTTV